MKVIRLILASVVFAGHVTILAPAAASMGDPAMVVASLEAQRRFIKTGLVISAAFTKAAVEGADERVKATYRDLQVMRLRAVTAERSARDALKLAAAERLNASESDRAAEAMKARADKAEADAAKLQADLVALEETWLARLASRDFQYAASQKVFAAHMSNIVERDDPRIAAMLERYLEGDVEALNELSEYADAVIASNRAADEAAKTKIENDGRRRDGDMLRSIASIWSDAAEKGQKSVASVLAKWQEAAALDPDNFEQWAQIARYAFLVGAAETQRQAATELWSRALTLAEKATANQLCSVADGSRCNRQWIDLEYRQEEIRLRREMVERNPGSPLELLRLAEILSLEGSWMPEMDDDRKAKGQEALALLERLRQQYPGNEYIELRCISAAARTGIRLTPGAERDKQRTDLERGIELARAEYQKSQGSWLKADALASLLASRSLVADADRDEKASVALTDEAISLIEPMLARDTGNFSVVRALWSAYTRAGMSAVVYADFGRARDHYRKLLSLIRPYSLGDRTYMVVLTSKRLADAELALGNIEVAKALLMERATLKPPYGKLGVGLGMDKAAQERALDDAYISANYAFVAQNYAEAALEYRELFDALGSNGLFPSFSNADRLMARIIAGVKLFDVFLEQGRYGDSLAIYIELSGLITAAESDASLQKMAKIMKLTVDSYAADLPNSGVHWGQIDMPDVDVREMKNITLDSSEIAKQFIARRRALGDVEPQNASPKDQMIGSLRKNCRVASDMLAEEPPPSEALYVTAVACQFRRALAMDPDVSWQMVADDYLWYYKRGWITAAPSLSDMYFALARAALIRHKAEKAVAVVSEESAK